MDNSKTDQQNPDPKGSSRREFLLKMALGGAGVIATPFINASPKNAFEEPFYFNPAKNIPVTVSVNGHSHAFANRHQDFFA